MNEASVLSREWATHPLWFQAAAIAVQFLWQACALTVLLLLVERRTRSVGARIRYRRSLATLLAIAAAPLLTLAIGQLRSSNDSNTSQAVAQAEPPENLAEPAVSQISGEVPDAFDGDGNASRVRDEFDEETTQASESVSVDGPLREPHPGSGLFVGIAKRTLPEAAADRPVEPGEGESPSIAATDVPSDATSRFSLALPWWLLPTVTSVWLTGTAVLLIRLLVGTFILGSWAHRAAPLSASARQIADRVSKRLGLRRLPAIVASHEVDEPLAAGVISPRIFVPSDWLTTLSDECLEAILAHELAHVRRGDLRVNLLQRVIEALWFFHPAVWWLTRRIRRERELCCDREAVSATGNPLAYAAALEFVVERALAARRPGMATGMGDDSMAVLRRVKAVLGAPSDQPATSWWRVGLLSAAIPAGLWLGSISLIPAAAGDGKEDPPPARADNGNDDEEDGPREPRRDPPPREREDRPAPRRPEGERREEGGPREERPRDDGDRPRPPREGSPRDEARRDERPREDRPREDGRRDEGRRERVDGPRPPQHEGPANEQMLRLIRELREEINELRREVRELRGNRGPGPEGRGDRPREGERRGPDGDRKDGDRDRPRPVERDGFRPPKDNFTPPRDGEPRREGGPKEGGPRRDGDRRPEGERGPRDGAPREAGPREGGPRPEGKPPQPDRRDSDRRPDGPPREGLPKDPGPRDGDRRPPEGERRPPRDGDRKAADNPPPRREERKPEPPPERKPEGDKPADKRD
jgi:hypothetical protein